MEAALVLAIVAVLGIWVVFGVAIRRWGPGKAHRWVWCPTKRFPARLLVDQREGEFGSLVARDVLACSLFPEAPVTCGKECLSRL